MKNNSFIQKTSLAVLTVIFLIVCLVVIIVRFGWLSKGSLSGFPLEEPIWTLKNTVTSPNPVLCVKYSPDGRILSYSNNFGEVYFLDATTGHIKSLRRTAHEGGIAGGILTLDFAPTGDLFAYGGNREVDVTDTKDLQSSDLSYGWRDLQSEVSSVVFSPDSNFLAAGGSFPVGAGDKFHYGGIIKIWDLRTQKLKWKKIINDKVSSVTFSPNGKLLASADSGGLVKLWDVQCGKVSATLKKTTYPVRAVAFSSNGKFVVGAGGDVDVWNVHNRNLERTMPKQGGYVKSIAFIPQSTLLATATNRGVISVWDISNGHEVKRFPEQATYITSIACSPKGKILASASGDGFIKTWSLDGLR